MKYLGQEIALFATQAMWAANKREDRLKQRARYSPEYYSTVFRSLSIKLPRMSGHTTAAVLLGDESGSIIVVPDQRQVQQLRAHRRETANYTYSIHDIIGGQARTRGVHPSLVIVDEASVISDKDRHYMMNLYSQSDPFYVWLA